MEPYRPPALAAARPRELTEQTYAQLPAIGKPTRKHHILSYLDNSSAES